jgi:hypothetical protein
MLEIEQIRKMQRQNLYVPKIYFETALQNFNGLTFFQIFRTNPSILQLLEFNIEELNLKDKTEINQNGLISDNINIRRMYYLLNVPMIQDGEKSYKQLLRPNVMTYTIFDRDNQHVVDWFLRLLFLSREQKLSDLIGNFDCFEALFATHSEQTQMFFPKVFIENYQCQEVKSLPWQDGTTLITFGSPHSLYTPKQIAEKVKEQQLGQMSLFNRISGAEAAYN